MRTDKIIFMIDDDIDDQEIFADALNSINPSIKCVSFVNGAQALKKLLESGATLPDFIFTDFNMPIMNGYEFLNELKHDEHLKNIPVVMYTTSSEQEQQDEAIKLGASSVLNKPSSMSELKKKLEEILSQE